MKEFGSRGEGFEYHRREDIEPPTGRLTLSPPSLDQPGADMHLPSKPKDAGRAL